MKNLRSSFGAPAAAAALFVLLATALAPQTADPTPAEAGAGDPASRQGPTRLEASIAEYAIKASVFILGNLGTVGSLTLERRLDRQNSELIKTFRVSGRTKPEMVRKGRDIGGEFTTVTRSPVRDDREAAQEAAGDDPETGTFYTGILEKNGVAKGERVVFYPDFAVSTKTDGTEKKIDGKFESLLSGFEFFLDHPVRPGEIYESKFILDGYPYIFKCEAGREDVLDDYGVKAYRIDVTTYDGRLKDERGEPVVVKKKGGIRLWLCKEEPYKNIILRMKLQYKWYLTLFFNLRPTF